ncbi:uncharacterized protein LAJ45_03119 [Morchella importuna]|uniref:uncharacterized protein n=1 Tax=Morchella importuna TaxID=1174673 RepID=UPI001E8DA350|nr:uncharacterized protein LAJ45_03119 [Morchella importuna]KAH8152893.1 hypothetical protein LAJ45_03119 [Morchella importuna]
MVIENSSPEHNSRSSTEFAIDIPRNITSLKIRLICKNDYISKLAYYPGRSPYVLAGILRHERPARPAPPDYNLRARLRRRTVPLSGTARRYGSRPEGTRQCSGRLGRHEIPSPSGDARME